MNQSLPLSKCCNAPIVEGNEQEICPRDKCSQCQRVIGYALMTPSWAKRESCGVFRDFSGNLWFFWQQIGSWKEVQERVKSGHHIYLDQIDVVVDSVANREDEWGDLICPYQHRKFMLEYKSQVKNPEIADLYCKNR